jgi:hypothetical protein
MGFGARLAGTQFTFLSTLGATRGAPHAQRLFLGNFHRYTMRVSARQRWSVLTNASKGLSHTAQYFGRQSANLMVAPGTADLSTRTTLPLYDHVTLHNSRLCFLSRHPGDLLRAGYCVQRGTALSPGRGGLHFRSVRKSGCGNAAAGKEQLIVRVIGTDPGCPFARMCAFVRTLPPPFFYLVRRRQTRGCSSCSLTTVAHKPNLVGEQATPSYSFRFSELSQPI